MPAPRTDPAILARALELCRTRGYSPKAAEEELAREGLKVSYRTIYRALQEAGAEGEPAPAAIVVAEPAAAAGGPPAELPAAALEVAFGSADPQKAAALRRMIAATKYNAATVARLAATWQCSERDVRALVIEAAILAGEHVLPPELAREESIEVARRVRDKAMESADWKSVLMAQAHIDRVQLPPAAKPGALPEGLTMAEWTAMLRRIVRAVAKWPGAVEAVRQAVEGG